MDQNNSPMDNNFLIPEDDNQTSSGGLGGNLGGIDLPDNVQKWLLVVLVMCLIGVILWGKDSYESRLKDKDEIIKKLETKDCGEEIDKYIKLIDHIKRGRVNELDNVSRELEENKSLTDKYLEASIDIDSIK
jgi:hypothetical protein